MEQRRIAIFIKHLTVGGLQKMMVRLANEFAQRGHTVELVVAKGEGPLARDVASNVHIVALDSHRMWNALPNLMRYVSRSKPDALLAAGWQVNVIAIWAKLLSRTRFRLGVSVQTNSTRQSETSDVWFAPLSPWAIKAFYPLADVVSAVSQGVLDDLSEISSRAVRNGHVIYNPVVSDELMEASRQEVSHPWFEEESNVPVLLGVGRMDPQKNFVLLVRAFAKLNHHCEARLVILGDGNERGKLKALVRELGVEDKVDFIGFKDNPYKYMANASLFVLSSNFEGLPTVLIEALACGCPVVSTDCPSGPHEILEGGKWGRLVPVGDEEALAEAMQEALSEPHDPDRLRQRAMDFTADRVVDDYLDVFFPSRVTRNKAQRAA